MVFKGMFSIRGMGLYGYEKLWQYGGLIIIIPLMFLFQSPIPWGLYSCTEYRWYKSTPFWSFLDSYFYAMCFERATFAKEDARCANVRCSFPSLSCKEDTSPAYRSLQFFANIVEWYVWITNHRFIMVYFIALHLLLSLHSHRWAVCCPRVYICFYYVSM